MKNSAADERRFDVVLRRMDKGFAKIDNRFEQVDKRLAILDKNFKLVYEGHGALDKKIDDFRHELRGEISLLQLSQNLINDKLKDVIIRIDRIEDKYDKSFDEVMKYRSGIDDDIQLMKVTIASNADGKQLVILEKEMAEVKRIMERKIGEKLKF